MDFDNLPIKAELVAKLEGNRSAKFLDVILKWISPSINAKEEKYKIDNENYKIVSQAKAEAEAALIKEGADAELLKRYQFRKAQQGMTIQHNIENVLQEAAEDLLCEEDVSDAPVDNDWTTRFFNYVGDISNKEMQSIWAKILAGEIKQPSSFSLRTLDVLRNLSKGDAEVFTEVAKYAIDMEGSIFLYRGGLTGDRYPNVISVLEEFNITYNKIALLVECGLLTSEAFLIHLFPKVKDPTTHSFVIGDKYVKMDIAPETPEFSIPIYTFTTAGKELLKLIKRKPDNKYIQYFAASLKSENREIKYAELEEVNKNGIHSREIFKVFPEL